MRTYCNPVFEDTFADPFVMCVNDVFYAFGTAPGDTQREFPVLRSTNLTTWERLGLALNRVDGHLGNTYWAPEVAYSDGLFWMYYSVGFGDKHHQIRVATSPNPAGPYEDRCQISSPCLPFAIDAHPFKDSDGRWYLFFATDLLESDRPGTVLMVDELLAMDRLAGQPRLVQRASRPWQLYEASRSIYDGIYDWHTLEGPFVVPHGGKYYCLYSGGNWQNETYGVDFAVADHPLGPYAIISPETPRVLKTGADVSGPGHCSVVTAEGVEYLVYHAWDQDRSGRKLCIDPLVWGPQGPACDGPTCSERTTR